MFIVQPPPPKISQIEARFTSRKVMLVFALIGTFFVNVLCLLSVGMLPWNLVGFFASLIAMIFFGYSIWKIEKKRKNVLGASKTHEKVLSDGGGGPLIH